MVTNNAKNTPKKITKSDWDSARKLWESDPTKSFADVGKILGISKQSVHYRAQLDKWAKVTNMAEIARRAQEKADGFAPVAGAANSVDAAVDLRAELLKKHREEWKGARSHIYSAIQNSDMEKAKLGKVVAEGLKIMQDGERKAHGLESDGDGGTMNVTIHRT